jgi:putative hydrolase of the HAD superfamily
VASSIKAILIDSGRVLNRPATGHWFITPKFFEHVDKKTFSSISKSERNFAFSKAAEYISEQALIETEEQENKHFLEYYKIFFQNLPKLN